MGERAAAGEHCEVREARLTVRGRGRAAEVAAIAAGEADRESRRCEARPQTSAHERSELIRRPYYERSEQEQQRKRERSERPTKKRPPNMACNPL